MSSLYEITNQFLEAIQQIENMELEDQDLVNDTLEAIQAPLEEKAENVIKYMKNLEALAEAKKAEAKRLQEAAQADLNKVERLKSYLDQNLQRAGLKNLQAGLFEVKYRKGSEVVEIDETKIPTYEEQPGLYIPQPPKFAGKADLKKWIKEGNQCPGVSLVRKADTLVIK